MNDAERKIRLVVLNYTIENVKKEIDMLDEILGEYLIEQAELLEKITLENDYDM